MDPRAALERAYRWAATHQWVLVAMLCFVSIGYTYQSGVNRERSQTMAGRVNRVDLCESIDADHNRERNNIVQNEALIYRVPAFRVLVADPEGEREAYLSARRRYLAVRETRPKFCHTVSNPVPDFPSLQAFRDGRVTTQTP